MSVYKDIATALREDATIHFEMTPAANVSGWTIRYQETRRFACTSGLVERWVASGFNNVSGINVTNGPTGVMAISLRAGDTSGRDFGAYSYRIERMDSGFQSVLTEGFRLITP